MGDSIRAHTGRRGAATLRFEVASHSAGEAVVIRAADTGDLDGLVSLSLACARRDRGWAGAYWSPPAPVAERSLWWERLRDGRTWVAVACAGPTRVGCVSFWPARGEAGLHLAYLAGPLVDPDWWGEGIGARLHATALTEMARLGYRRAELVVGAGNRRGREFLARNGWQRLGEGPQRSEMALMPYARAVRQARPALEPAWTHARSP